MRDVRGPLCGCVIGGVAGIPDVPVRYFCQKCKREVTIEARNGPLPPPTNGLNELARSIGLGQQVAKGVT